MVVNKVKYIYIYIYIICTTSFRGTPDMTEIVSEHYISDSETAIRPGSVWNTCTCIHTKSTRFDCKTQKDTPPTIGCHEDTLKNLPESVAALLINDSSKDNHDLPVRISEDRPRGVTRFNAKVDTCKCADISLVLDDFSRSEGRLRCDDHLNDNSQDLQHIPDDLEDSGGLRGAAASRQLPLSTKEKSKKKKKKKKSSCDTLTLECSHLDTNGSGLAGQGSGGSEIEKKKRKKKRKPHMTMEGMYIKRKSLSIFLFTVVYNEYIVK